jgi:hypothetical protein
MIGSGQDRAMNADATFDLNLNGAIQCHEGGQSFSHEEGFALKAFSASLLFIRYF